MLRRLPGLVALTLTALSVVLVPVGRADAVGGPGPFFYRVCADDPGVTSPVNPCTSHLDDALAAIAADDTSGQAATIALGGGEYCPTTIPALNVDLTIYGLGDQQLLDGPPQSTVPQSELAYFSRANCAGSGTAMLSAPSVTKKLTLINLSFDGTSSGAFDGADVHSSGNGSFTVRDVTVHHVAGTGVHYAGESLLVENSVFLDNQIGLSAPASGRIVGSTFSGNTNSSGQGEGIYAAGFLKLYNNTITNNDRGVDVELSSSAEAWNNIVAGNTHDCFNGTTNWEHYNGQLAGGYNVTGADCFHGTTDVTYAGNSAFGQPVYDGGPTDTIVSPGSANIAGSLANCGSTLTGTDGREALGSGAATCYVGARDGNTTVDSDAQADQTSIDLGDITVGTTSGQGSVLSNAGGDLVGIKSVSVTGAGFSLSFDTCTQALLTKDPDQTCSATIQAAPTAAGPLTGNLLFHTSGGDVNVALHANGVEPHVSGLVAPTAATIAYGAHRTLTTTLTDVTDGGTALGDRVVELQAKPAGTSSYTTITTTTTSATGTASTAVTPTGTTAYRWSYAGGNTNGAVVSAAAITTVSQIVRAKLQKASVKKGKAAKVTGTVSPTGSGAKAQLQQHTSNGTWKTIDTTTVRKGGFTLVPKTTSKGTQKLRVMVLASNGLASDISSTLTLKVT